MATHPDGNPLGTHLSHQLPKLLAIPFLQESSQRVKLAGDGQAFPPAFRSKVVTSAL
jgi:hypothetical protein